MVTTRVCYSALSFRRTAEGRAGAWVSYEGTHRCCVQERALNIPRGRFLVKGLIQSIRDLSDASIGAGFVLVAARRATDANCADRLVSDLDRDATLDSNELSIVERGIERARRSNLLASSPVETRRMAAV